MSKAIILKWLQHQNLPKTTKELNPNSLIYRLDPNDNRFYFESSLKRAQIFSFTSAATLKDIEAGEYEYRFNDPEDGEKQFYIFVGAGKSASVQEES